MKTNFEELLSKAEQFSKENIKWHHHYLPPGCLLNTSSKHLLILEGKNSKWEVGFDSKPMDHLEKLENLFFKRIKCA